MTVPDTSGVSRMGSPTGPGQRVVPHLWFDSRAEEATEFYASLFGDSSVGRKTRYGKEGKEIHGQPEGSIMTVDFTIGGLDLIALNGGPHFEFTPAISLFVTCETVEEVERLWEALSDGGKSLMPLDAYPWSERYGWVADRYGLTWQLFKGDLAAVHGQRIVPCLAFSTANATAKAAMEQYVGLFPESRLDGVSTYGDMGGEPADFVAHAQFLLDGQLLMAMDSGPDHDWGFNEAISLLIQCQGQAEVDHYWDGLVDGGQPQQCGWLKDRFGVVWQVSPVELRQMLLDADPARVGRVTEAFLQMKKFDIAALQAAFDGK